MFSSAQPTGWPSQSQAAASSAVASSSQRQLMRLGLIGFLTKLFGSNCHETGPRYHESYIFIFAYLYMCVIYVDSFDIHKHINDRTEPKQMRWGPNKTLHGDTSSGFLDVVGPSWPTLAAPGRCPAGAVGNSAFDLARKGGT